MFADFAQKYWDAGLPVMPLRPNSKIPALPSWQTLCHQMPTAEDQAAWLSGWGDGNMGLPLGPQSGVIGLDLDSEDPRVIAVLNRFMPTSPWKRVGKKGAVYAFKYNGERTYRIKDSQGNTLLELLSRGTQIVMPPSIHPDTGRPYEANCHLVDVLDQLPVLPSKFEDMIRQGLLDAGLQLSHQGSTKIINWVPAGGRDSAMVAFAGLQARAVIHKEITLLEALHQMETWVMSFTEQVVGDQIDPDKARKKVLEFLRRDILENKRQLPKGWDTGMTAEEKAEMKTYFGDEAEAWSSKEFMDHIQHTCERMALDDTVGRQELINDVLVKVARSEHVNEIEIEMIFNFLSTATGKLVNLGALRRQLREYQRDGIKGEHHTEIAEALLADLEQAGEIRFTRQNFYQWRGSHWQKLDESEIMSHLAREFGSLPGARKFNDHKGILQIAQRLKTQDLEDSDIGGINFANGFLTKDLKLMPHDPMYGATSVMPYRYMPDERAPAMFMSFLDQCWGHDPDYLEKVQALREAIAVTLFGEASIYQRAFCMYGIPHSGKSELVKLILGLMSHDVTCMVPPQEWNDRFMPSQMVDKLMNHCGELSESELIPGTQFKLIVEGASMSGQYKGKDIFMFKPRCAHWFSSNHLPRTRDTSDGFNRRWLMLTFNKACRPEDKRDGLAGEILSEEREAIVAWAVPARLDLIRNRGYTLPKSHEEAMNEVASQNNSVRHFLVHQELINIVPDEVEMLERDVYAQYYAFCKTVARSQPVALKRFRVTAQELQESLGFKIVKTGPGDDQVVYQHLKLAKKASR